MALGSDTQTRAELAKRVQQSGGWTLGRMLALAIIIGILLLAAAAAL